MRQYLDLLRHVREHGRYKKDRTGTGCFSIYGAQYRVNLADGFPLLTTKKVSLRWVAEELFWFLKGDTSNESLLAKGVDIWNEWALKEDHLVSEGKSKTITELLKELHAVIGGEYTKVRRTFYERYDKLSDEQFEAWLAAYGVTTNHPDVIIAKGSLGPIYGAQWRDFGGVDQITQVLKDLRERPFSRRHIVSAWKPTVAPDERVSVEQNILNGKAALASCHCFFQLHCTELTFEERLVLGNGLETEAKLDEHNVPKIGLMLQFYQRSADTPLGVPFNIASYALLLLMVANELNYHPMEVIHDLGDTHIYANQLEGADEQLSRTPGQLPTVRLKCPVGTSIFDITWEDIELLNYNPQTKISFEISV